jgi:hypothetical protein
MRNNFSGWGEEGKTQPCEDSLGASGQDSKRGQLGQNSRERTVRTGYLGVHLLNVERLNVE